MDKPIGPYLSEDNSQASAFAESLPLAIIKRNYHIKTITLQEISHTASYPIGEEYAIEIT